VRRIIHIDMDAFFASVEQRDRPELRGCPVVVGGRPDTRGVVAAASYEARAFGVHSAMAMAKAVRLCPHLSIVPPDFSKYSSVSSQILDLFRSVTPLVEPLSLDEAYLDVTDNAWGEPLAVNVARRLKAAVRETTALTASAGVAPNKFLAKVASGWQKPDGLTVVAPERVESFLHGLPIDSLWGVGPVTAAKLRAIGLEKVVDLRRIDRERLRQVVGRSAEWLARLAMGIDDRPVEPHRTRKSVGTENTFAEDVTEPGAIREAINQMARENADWLERHGLYARTVTIKVRYPDFTTRSDTRVPATRDADALAGRAIGMLEKTEAGSRPVRLLGVSLHGLADQCLAPPAAPASPQLSLFDA
jgi:DNA polymerase-4